jgi:Raf kinase inhibitor-like YbhB/YbcL family protein
MHKGIWLNSWLLGCILLIGSGEIMAMELKSSAFAQGGMIPSQYTCKGDDISPPLEWNNAPSAAQSFVLICDDPDAPVGIWDHWVVFNLPSSVNELPENVQHYPAGTILGKNSSGHTQYDGPCPPSGTHRYFFKLYALDTTLSLNKGATKQQIMKAIEGHVIENAELMGRFQK